MIIIRPDNFMVDSFANAAAIVGLPACVCLVIVHFIIAQSIYAIICLYSVRQLVFFASCVPIFSMIYNRRFCAF